MSSSEARPAKESEKWLNAYYDPLASLQTFSQCMTLCNVIGDGENRLVVADLGNKPADMKLKVFKGTSKVQENTIIDLPTGIVSFYLDQNQPRVPAIAVASGSSIYIYKNMRPYFKFTMPALPVNPVEEEAWRKHKEGVIPITQLKEILDEQRNEGACLTVRSLRLLQIEFSQAEEFCNLYKNLPLKRQTVCTCIGIMQKSYQEEDAISCLVVGTENNQLYVLDPEAFTVLAVMELPAAPVFLSISGLFDVEYRIVVACRNGFIYQLKRGMKNVSSGIELTSAPVGMVRVTKNIIVGCMDNTIQCYTPKGRKVWTVRVPSNITCMAPLIYPPKNVNAVFVALADRTLQIYQDKQMVDMLPTEDVVTGLVFGRYGREDGSLLMATKGGGFIIKLLKRSADFSKSDQPMGPPASQFQRLNVPKKTKLFVDQTFRERENAVGIHRQFMHDLSRLRLNSAKSFADALETRMNPVSNTPTDSIKLNAEVQGIGPMFKLTINVQNNSMTTASQDMFITFSYDSNVYKMGKCYIPAPYLVPSVNYKFNAYVECLSDKGIADIIKVFVVKSKNTIPIITGVINMPPSESILVV